LLLAGIIYFPSPITAPRARRIPMPPSIGAPTGVPPPPGPPPPGGGGGGPSAREIRGRMKKQEDCYYSQ